MVLLDLLGRRWTLRVLWELRDGDSLTFRELQARCDNASSSVLAERLRELREADIVAAQPSGGYVLTAEGQSLLGALQPIDEWSRRWERRTASSGS